MKEEKMYYQTEFFFVSFFFTGTCLLGLFITFFLTPHRSLFRHCSAAQVPDLCGRHGFKYCTPPKASYEMADAPLPWSTYEQLSRKIEETQGLKLGI